MKQKLYYFMVLLFAVVLFISVSFNLKGTMDQRNLLVETVETNLISVSNSARQLIDVDELLTYTDKSAASQSSYKRTLADLRNLAQASNASYIYVLRYFDGECLFVFDTDLVDTEIFIPYEISEVHRAAFSGAASTEMMAVDDIYGTFNTAAIPIFKNGEVVGIVCVDFEDLTLSRSWNTIIYNTVLMIVVLVIAIAAALIVIRRLLNQVTSMQKKLEHLANYDNVTGLPNRQYLLTYLEELSRKDAKPFALIFIDLDNFKLVNDTAGHDAGDELLRYIANYLNGSDKNVVSFRPSAGKLNIAARIGGDEFIQVITGVETVEQAEAVGRKLVADFNALKDNRFVSKYNVGMSIGVALYPYHSDNFHVLIKYADSAMYHAKRAGKNQAMVYTDEMQVIEN